MADMSYAQAIRMVIEQEMKRDERVFVMGEDVEKLGGVFGTTRDLYKEFGTDRIRNTPISESAIVGAALGAACAGMRPVAELMYWDFSFVAADQIKFRYRRAGGKVVGRDDKGDRADVLVHRQLDGCPFAGDSFQEVGFFEQRTDRIRSVHGDLYRTRRVAGGDTRGFDGIHGV